MWDRAALLLNQAQQAFLQQCYFVLSGLPTPIFYNVDRIRDGRSYSTRAVRAVQDGKTIFMMLSSFQKPEPWQPIYRSPIPNVPAPEECDTYQAYLRKCAEEQTDDWKKRRYYGRAKVCSLSHLSQALQLNSSVPSTMI
jgi:acyl-CoA thioesterase II